MKKTCIILVYILTLSLAPAISYSADVTLRWQGNTELDLASYNAYYGTAPRAYGAPVPIGKTTSYTINNLQNGTTYYFALTAVDNAGNESGYSSEVSITTGSPDTTAPVVTIVTPTDDDAYTAQAASISLAGNASDDRSLKTITWASSSGASGTASGSGNWSVNTIALVEGSNVISVTATDDAGNTAQDKLTVSYTSPDTTAPVVTIVTPTDDDAYTAQAASISLAGTASDDRSLKTITWASSSGASGTASGSGNWSVNTIALVEGSNVISVTATDDAGNTAQDKLTVSYTPPDTTPPDQSDEIAPEIAITSPTTRTRYLSRGATIDIAGVAEDNDQIEKVTWRNSRGEAGTCDGTDNWRASGIRLNRWWNTITVTATDASKNSSYRNLTVFCWR